MVKISPEDPLIAAVIASPASTGTGSYSHSNLPLDRTRRTTKVRLTADDGYNLGRKLVRLLNKTSSKVDDKRHEQEKCFVEDFLRNENPSLCAVCDQELIFIPLMATFATNKSFMRSRLTTKTAGDLFATANEFVDPETEAIRVGEQSAFEILVNIESNIALDQWTNNNKLFLEPLFDKHGNFLTPFCLQLADRLINNIVAARIWPAALFSLLDHFSDITMVRSERVVRMTRSEKRRLSLPRR